MNCDYKVWHKVKRLGSNDVRANFGCGFNFAYLVQLGLLYIRNNKGSDATFVYGFMILSKHTG